MKEIFAVLQDWLTQSGLHFFAGSLSLIVTFFGAFEVVWTLMRKLWTFQQQRKLRRDLHPFYTNEEIELATQYYIHTKFQNVAPAKDDEPGRTHAVAAKEKILPFFLKKAFRQDDCQYYTILADSGMGKTTFMINLYLRYAEQFFAPKYRIKLFPLGWPEIDREIEAIDKAEQKNTILLLDAFDEDSQALHHYKTRLEELIQKTKHFREVVISCRTQFFPSEEEEPKETGVMRFSGDGGERVFYKLYLSPFDDTDIKRYLRKRFAWYHFRKKRKARQIVRHSPNLMVRPMLLNYIDDLLQTNRVYTSSYMVYAELIERWIQREAQKVPVDRRKHYKEELFNFSREIAKDIYQHRDSRQGALMIPGSEIQTFADKYEIRLSEMEMKSRSLLNRNARGQYKFSHKSILEYFLAEEALFTPDFRRELDFEGMDVAEEFLRDMVVERLTLPFFERKDVSGEYRLNGKKSRPLMTLRKESLVQMTHLTLGAWADDEDPFFLKGLPKLKVLNVNTSFRSAQYRELRELLPGCQITDLVTEDEIQDVFGLEVRNVSIDGEDYKRLQPCEYTVNQYEKQGDVILDRTTGLMWQQAGSENYMVYEDALKYVEELNRQKFAGYGDWRLPIIPELMSLLEPERQSNGLYIDPVFDSTQRWCWGRNLRREKGEDWPGSAWGVDFYNGDVGWGLLYSKGYVRAVRS